MRTTPLFLAALGMAACGGDVPATRPPLVTPLASASATPAADPGPVPAAREDGHLPSLARPLRYAVDLQIDPRKERFSGAVRILVDVPSPTAYVVLDARDLVVRRATAIVGSPSRTLIARTSARASHGAHEPDELVLAFPEPLPAGHATLEIGYDAPFGRTLSGLYRAFDGGQPYVFSQFEAADARRAFPCFDEPELKTPYDVSIAAPEGALAFSNGSETARTSDSGMVTHRFATTAPLPSYLVAFAVGDFEVKQAKGTKVPLRAITTRGKTAYADTLLKTASDLLPLFAQYFGVEFPYEKLDLVAVPDFGAGGMENAGFITFRDDAVLLDEHASLRSLRGMTGLVAHELAHQWFGDLVTMRWWDDLWLNEGFATWMTYKVVEMYKPEYGSAIDAAQSAEYIMDQDGLASARAIRQPVASVGQAMEAFDGITYQKGAAVLRMLEHYVGAGAFQQGVRAYLHDHAWGNATVDDFLGSVDAAAQRKVSGLAHAYFDQPGVPLVVFDSLKCDPNAFRAEVHQERFAPLGASLPAQAPWTVPLCVQSARNGSPPTCDALRERATLGGAGACPVIGNADAAGYYHVALATADLRGLVGRFASLDVATRVAVLADAWAQTRAGKLDAEVLMRTVLPAVDSERDRHVIEQLIGILYALSEAVDDAALPSFSAYARARLEPHLRRLRAQAKLDDDARLLRRSLTYAAIDLGDDAALLRTVTVDATTFGRDPKAFDPDYGQAAVELAARTKPPAELQRALAEAKTPQEHALALRAASDVVDPAAVDAQLQWMLSPAVKLQDVRGILWPMAHRRTSRARTLAFVRDHWDALRGKLPGALARGLVGMAGYACTQPDVEQARAFFSARSRDLEGSERPLAQALESASLCVALRAKVGPEIAKAISSSAAAGLARR